jgi:hypothetical protein
MVGHRALGTGASSTTIIGGSANRRNDHTQHSHDSYEYQRPELSRSVPDHSATCSATDLLSPSFLPFWQLLHIWTAPNMTLAPSHQLLVGTTRLSSVVS